MTRTVVRVAILGNGFARKVILPCLRNVEGIEIAGIASRDLERARATAGEFAIPLVAADYCEILKKARPDLVYVATPPHRHAEMSIDALAAGCHVVCEKPTALSAKESGRMLLAARAAGGRLALIDHELRFHPGRVALRELIAQGALGTIHHVTYIVRSPSRRDPSIPWSWWSDAEQGGGALGAIGSHAIDALRVLAGGIAAVHGTLQTFVPERTDPETGLPRSVTSDDFAAAWIRFQSGALASLMISLVEGERLHRLLVAGSEGAASLDEQGSLRVGRGRELWTERQIEWGLPPAEELGIPDTDWARSFLLMSRRLVEAIRRGEDTLAGAATFADGHEIQLVLDAIRRSVRERGWSPVQEA